eukprot:GHVL01035425.1.p1 GENE.GHVL01035425.1~~GHVL01035425.1.p1  ORF type:complete len:697 (+),score=126.86 GHVL01035425.1:126-2216(+)
MAVQLHEPIPVPGRIIRDLDNLDYITPMICHQSLEQARKNIRHIHDDGELFYWTSDIDIELPIHTYINGAGSETPMTVVEMFARVVLQFGAMTALGYKYNKKYVYWTWQKYWDECCIFAKSLIASGLNKNDRVCIMGHNCCEWFVACNGCIFAGGIPVGIYPTNSIDATEYIINITEASIIIVNSIINLEKINEIIKRGKCNIKLVIVFRENPNSISSNIVFWNDYLNFGKDVEAGIVASRMSSHKPGHCCLLIFTSGTTGNPKGVMLSHDNVTWTAKEAADIITLGCDDVIVSFLPLSHVAAEVLDIFAPMSCGASVCFATEDALKGELLQTLLEVRPTLFLAVPRVWEKIEEKMKALGAGATGLRKRLTDWAKETSLKTLRAQLQGESSTMSYNVANYLVYSKIRRALGLDRCRLLATATAPLPKATALYFLSLNMPLADVYGMSECTGPQTSNLPAAFKYKEGSIGLPLPGTEMLIYEPDKDGIGELCWRGRGNFMGYYKNPEATRKSIDRDGFLHSGDLGYIDSDGFAFISGRIKELIITSGGENIPPLLIEQMCKEEMPFISQCQIIGDGKRYLSLLICLKTVVEKSGNPTTQLADSVIVVLKESGSNCNTCEEAAKCPLAHKAISHYVDKVNKRAVARVQQIRAWRILPREFAEEFGEITPSQKLRRNIVIKNYANLIEEIYEDNLKSKL